MRQAVDILAQEADAALGARQDAGNSLQRCTFTAIVTLSDTFARVIFAPIELPVGIIMAFLGAPFFLFLLRREI